VGGGQGAYLCGSTYSRGGAAAPATGGAETDT